MRCGVGSPSPVSSRGCPRRRQLCLEFVSGSYRNKEPDGGETMNEYRSWFWSLKTFPTDGDERSQGGKLESTERTQQNPWLTNMRKDERGSHLDRKDLTLKIQRSFSKKKGGALYNFERKGKKEVFWIFWELYVAPVPLYWLNGIWY